MAETAGLNQKRKASLTPSVDNLDVTAKRVKAENSVEETALEKTKSIGESNDNGHDDGLSNDGLSKAANAKPIEISSSPEQARQNLQSRQEHLASIGTSRSNPIDVEAKDARRLEARRSSDGYGTRKNDDVEEKKRVKRLFGGLVSTLGQTAASSKPKKRPEVQRQNQDRYLQQQVEDARRRAEILAGRSAIRKAEQPNAEEEAMRQRHWQLRSLARQLHTNTEPKLYYLPKVLLPHQAQIIEDQIRDTEEIIEKELREFELARAGSVGEPKPPDVTNRGQTPTKASHQDKDHDDEMVQDKEDSVLY
ncbi:pinin/SDK/memA/ protein conserved region-domain-containing protein [Apodospora peruviana]|uniref:Pinin/SDK/memA/ protein conserved region-domain-containing protein n=1 Tax=Apodospora peruviana TaxID=516989 RepID=A0AAE0IBN7_9PEZI|nr:pinin/SDK/memA/ protein conserved region-domain-containing protein [Apodospora peruviana]